MTTPNPGVEGLAKDSESLQGCSWSRDKNETFHSSERDGIKDVGWDGKICRSRRIGVSAGLREGVEGRTHAGSCVRNEAMSRISTTGIGLINTISTESVDKTGEKWKSPENRC